jgi:sigma-E factor negative regulatory protein RseC
MDNLHDKNTISHKGVVQKSGNESVTVIISSSSACSGCHAEGACSLAGNEEKIIEVKGRYNLLEGDKVEVIMKQSDGFTAVFISYLLPLIIVITSLIVLLYLSFPEPVAGLMSIFFLLPYYLGIYLFRKKINDRFVFSLKV